jgi:hypothetical protein
MNRNIAIGALLIFLVVVINNSFDKIKSVFGFDTVASLQQKLEVQKQQTDTAVQVIAEEAKTNDRLVKFNDLKLDVILAVKAKEKIVREKTEKILATEKITIAEIEAKPTDAEREKDRQIATVQIDDIWTVYNTLNNKEI